MGKKEKKYIDSIGLIVAEKKNIVDLYPIHCQIKIDCNLILLIIIQRLLQDLCIPINLTLHRLIEVLSVILPTQMVMDRNKEVLAFIVHVFFFYVVICQIIQ